MKRLLFKHIPVRYYRPGMSSTLSSTISTTVQTLINDIFNGLQYVAKGVVDFIANNYDLIGLLVGFGMVLPMLWRMFRGIGLRGLFNLFG